MEERNNCTNADDREAKELLFLEDVGALLPTVNLSEFISLADFVK